MIGVFLAVPRDQLAAALADPSSVSELLIPEGEEPPANYLDLDKAWHGIHFLLTGEVWGGEGPLAEATLGGAEIGDDMGYGPALYATPEQVEAIATSLANVSIEQLESGYSPAEFERAQIYPTGIWEAEGQGALDYLTHYLRQLVDFYKSAAVRGDAVLHAIV
jgi:hypothetical protein